MSRFADAQRKAGRQVGADAELAWAEAQLALEPGSDMAIDGGSPVVDDGLARARSDSTLEPSDHVAHLARRLFAPPPAGLAVRYVMFSSIGCESHGVLRDLATRLAMEHPRTRTAVVRMHGDRPPPWAMNTPSIESITATPVDLVARIGELTARFDFALFDAGAYEPRAEFAALARAVDGVVLMISETSTLRRTAKAAAAGLQEARARVLGAVLCDRTYPIPAAIYDRL